MSEVDEEDDEGRGPESDEEGRKRGTWGRLDSLADVVRRAIAQGADAIKDEDTREKLVSEVVRKAISKGGEVVDSTEGSVRKLLGDLPLPKEVVDRIAARLDDYKGEMLGLLRQEVRAFFDRIDLGHELQKMLTSLSFEITTEIRFIPNEKSVGGTGVKPDVKSKVSVKRSDRQGKRSGTKRAPRKKGG
jgi:hypothetical protein